MVTRSRVLLSVFLSAAALLLLLGAIPVAATPPEGEHQAPLPAVSNGSTIDVSLPVQVTDNPYYERGQSIVYDGSNYWLFYGRSDTVTDGYDDQNPDVNDYEIYYKKAPSIAGLASDSATYMSGTGNSSIYLGETGAAFFGGEVWVFGPEDVGSDADLHGWYTSDGGASWTQVSSIWSGLSDGQAHHDEISFGGELWVVEGSGNFTTKHSATPKAGGWSIPLQVGASEGLTGGLVHFFAEGSDLYLAIWSGSNYIYKYNAGTVAWDLVDDVTPPEKYDPTLFKVDSTYVYAQAPWDSGAGRQYIIAWSNSSLDGTFFDNGYTNVTAGPGC